jgi:hypothetical protein
VAASVCFACPQTEEPHPYKPKGAAPTINPKSLLDDLQEWYHAPVRGITGKKKKNQGLKVGHPPNMQAMIQFTNIPVSQNRAFAGPMGANPTDAQQGARDPDIGAQFQDCIENGIHN